MKLKQGSSRTFLEFQTSEAIEQVSRSGTIEQAKLCFAIEPAELKT
jgi:hypothetical protein